MDDDKVQALLEEILRVVTGLAEELDRYREMLPEPGSIKARLLGRKVSSAVDQWNGS